MIDPAQDRLIEEIAKCSSDPLRYAKLVFPWRVPGSPLENYDGPDVWQLELMAHIKAEIAAKRFPIQCAVSAGHGVGKSALASMLTKWSLSTMTDARVSITANTGDQLATKTSPEIAHWHRMALDSHWFAKEATSLRSCDPRHEQTWRADLVTWSEHRPEAFAGLHNRGRRITLLMDEGSIIPKTIWDVAEGALTDTDTELIWIVFGNPTKGSGPFFDCFHRNRHRWFTMQVDSRSSSFTNKEKIARWIEDYGEDSDFVRVRVRGVFPRAGLGQFIPHDWVAEARTRTAAVLRDEPIVAGIDLALSGMDETVIAFRSGFDASLIEWKVFREADSNKLIGHITKVFADLRSVGIRVANIFADSGGLGLPICQRLRALGLPVTPINNSSAPTRINEFHDKGAEMWGLMKQWLSDGGVIPPADEVLAQQLTGREADYDNKNRYSLEPKGDMRERGLESPDRADALALTFAMPVFSLPAMNSPLMPKAIRTWDDNPFTEGRT